MLLIIKILGKFIQSPLSFYLASILILFCTISSPAQINKNGLPLIKNYSPEEYDAHSQNWAIIKDKRGMMYFGNNHGLLEFNGAKWKLYDNERSATIRSLSTDKNGFIYYGASQDFGIIVPDSLGGLRFFSLYKAYNSGNPDFNTIWGVQNIGNYVFFQSNEKIYKVESPFDTINLEKIKTKFKIYEAQTSFHWSFKVYDKFYVREQGRGILVEDNEELKLVPGSEIFAKEKVYVMLPYIDSKIIICSRESGLYIYDPKSKEESIEKLECEASNLLIKSVVYGGVLLPDFKYAISTLSNGIVVFNQDGDVIEQINTHTGIEDNQILSIYYDKDNSYLWCLAAEKGIYKANLGSPFREWNRKNGLSGVVVDLIRFNGKVYAATSNGVFVLDEKNKGFSEFRLISEIPYESWHFQIFKTNDKSMERLMVATTGGVFEMKDNKVEKIVDNQIALQLYQSKLNPEILYIGYIDGFGAIEYNEKRKKWIKVGKNDSVNNTIRSILETKQGTIFLGTQVAGVVKLDSLFDTRPLTIDTTQGLPLYGAEFRVFEIDDKLVFASPKGFFSYDKEEETVSPFNKFGEEYSNQELGVYGIIQADDTYWISSYSNNLKKSNWQGIVRAYKNEQDSFIVDKAFSKSIPQKVAYAMYDDGDYFWIANEKGLYKFDKTLKKNYKEPFNINILKVSTADDSVLFAGTFYEIKDSIVYISLNQIEQLKPELSYKNNQVTIEYSALFYEQEENTEYSYRLIGLSEKWSKWTGETKFPYTNLSPGDYRFEIIAKNIYGAISNKTSYEFTILPPWYMTIWAYTLFVIAAIAFVWLIVRLNVRRLKHEKKKLEEIVEERTTEIRMKNVELEQQKEEISAQRDEIEVQRDYVTLQKDQIEEQHDKIVEQKKSITDSIHYASRIQDALLPPKTILNEILPEHFILYKPRDIVSGDFYWASQKNNRSIIVAADCTGHGVPGAFMSMLGISYLNEVINKFDRLHANQILNELKENIKKSLRQTGKDDEAKDGMDMSLCILDFEKMQMEFSGAFNSMLLIRDNQLIKYEADRMPVGIYIKDRGSFTNHLIDMKKGDNYYIFSDGYVDQFGGERGTKLMTKRFKDILLKNHHRPATEQKEALENFLNHWQSFDDEDGEPNRQLDDILVIGMRI